MRTDNEDELLERTPSDEANALDEDEEDMLADGELMLKHSARLDSLEDDMESTIQQWRTHQEKLEELQRDKVKIELEFKKLLNLMLAVMRETLPEGTSLQYDETSSEWKVQKEAAEK